MKSALESKRVEVWHLHKVVRIKGHHNKRMRSFSFTETRDRMLKQLESWESGLNGNPVVRDGHKSTRFVVQLSPADARIFRALDRKRKTEQEWVELHAAAGTHRVTISELEAKAIPVWEAEAQGLLHTVSLYRLASVVWSGQKRQANHLAWKQRQMRRGEEPEQTASKPMTANEVRASLGLRMR